MSKETGLISPMDRDGRGGESNILIIGDGPLALGLAYYLDQQHEESGITVLCPQVLGTSVENRQLAIARSNYQARANTPFYEWSLKLWEGLSEELNYNVLFTRQGLLELLGNSELVAEASHRGNAMRLHGIDAEYLLHADLRKRLPMVDFSPAAQIHIQGGLLQPRAGFFNPMAVLFGFAKGLSPRRVRVVENTAIEEFLLGGGRGKIMGVRATHKGQDVVWRAQKVIVAMEDGGAALMASRPGLADFFTRQLGPIGGLHHANNDGQQQGWLAIGHGLELFSESLSPLFDNIIQSPPVPLLGQFYVGQGELGNIWVKHYCRPAHGHDGGMMPDGGWGITARRAALARQLVRLVPGLLRVKLLTEWQQTVVDSIDGSPIIDIMPGVDGLYIITGLGGDGVAHATGAAMAMAQLVVRGEHHPLAAAYRWSRFGQGVRIYERAM